MKEMRKKSFLHSDRDLSNHYHTLILLYAIKEFKRDEKPKANENTFKICNDYEKHDASIIYVAFVLCILIEVVKGELLIIIIILLMLAIVDVDLSL